VGSKALTIDGRPWEYRDPGNKQEVQWGRGDRGSAGKPKPTNRHAYDWSNSLYDYSKGSVQDAAKELGIGNVNKKDEVRRILDYIREGGRTAQAAEAAPEPTPEPPVRDEETVQRELAELNAGRDRYDNTRLDRPENNQPRYGFSDDPYKDAIAHGDDLNDHHQKFNSSLKAEAEQTSREIGFSGRNALNSFVGKVPQLGDPKDLFAYYSDKLTQSA